MMNEDVSINDLTKQPIKWSTKKLTNGSSKGSDEDIKSMSEDSCSLAADIVQVVQQTTKNATIKNSQKQSEQLSQQLPLIVGIQQLQERPYTDPINEQYFIFRNNHIGTPANTHGEEAAKTIHHIIHATGELPVW